MKSVFCLGSPEAKNTSIRASVRFVGKADKPCARRGCSAEKSQRDFFDGLSTPVFEPGRIFAVSLSVLVLILAVLTVLVLTVLLVLVVLVVLLILVILIGHDNFLLWSIAPKYMPAFEPQ